MQSAFLSNIIVCIKQAVGNRTNAGIQETIGILNRIANDKRVQDVLSEYPYLQETLARRSILTLLKKKCGISIYAGTVMGDFIKKKRIKRNVED